MSVEVVTYWTTLIQLAKKLGKARLEGNELNIKEAEEDLEYYKELIRKSDKMILG